MPARYGRRYVTDIEVQNPQAPLGPSYNDPVSGTIPITGTRTETLDHDAGTRSGTISMSGTRTEGNSHTVTVTGTIPLSGQPGESFSPPAGTSNPQRQREGYGD